MNPDVLKGMVIWLFFSASFYFAFWFFIDQEFSMLHPYMHVFFSLNLGTCGIVLMDKLFAQWRTRRIPESVFFTASLLGGSVGMLIGMHVFRHKTRKGSFQFILGLFILVQIVFLIFLFRENLEMLTF